MNLLILSDITYPPDHLPFPREVFAKRLSQSNFNITWVMRSGDEQNQRRIKKWNDDPIHILSNKDYSIIRSIVRSGIPGNKWISGIIDISNIDLVYVRNDYAMGIVARNLLVDKGIPYVYRMSALKIEDLDATPGIESMKKKAASKIRKTISEDAETTISISKRMEEYMVNIGYKSNIITIPTGVDTSIPPESISTNEFYHTYDLDSNKTNLLYMGKMDEGRNLEFLIRTFKKVKQQYKEDIELVMMGGNEEQIEHLKHLSAKNCVEEFITFTGWISNDNMVKKGIKFCDIGLSPLPPNRIGIQTSSPVKVLEYLGMKTPVVTSPIPDSEEIVQTSGAGRVSAYDESEFADNILTLLYNKNCLDIMGENGRQHVKKHRGYSTISEDMKRVLYQSVQGKR